VLEAQQGQIDSETFVPSSAWWLALTAEGGPVLISQSLEGFSGNSASYNASVSADGRSIVFSSEANNLAAGDANTATDINASGRISYQWLASGYDIYGATSNTLTLAQSQVNKIINLKATYTDTQGVTKTILAMATDRVANVNDPVTGQFTISGTTTQHQTLTAVTSTLADLDGMGSLYYQWFAGNDAIRGATASTLTLTQAQVGKAVSVKISYTDLSGMAESVTSSATGSVTIAGVALVEH